jgi:hypothetical protein
LGDLKTLKTSGVKLTGFTGSIKEVHRQEEIGADAGRDKKRNEVFIRFLKLEIPEMTQTLYAHMNMNKNKTKQKNPRNSLQNSGLSHQSHRGPGLLSITCI